MERRERRRCVYVSASQKKKLIELITKHPELISCKVNQNFNYKDSQNIWRSIANECNAIPGAKKTWMQWRKTWYDLRCNTKRRQAESNGEVTTSNNFLTQAEQEALGIKNINEETQLEDMHEENLSDISAASLSEPESLPEQKVNITTVDVNFPKKLKHSSKSSGSCNLSCDIIAAQEQRKLEIKEDYLSFKKEYLKQKLTLMKEQNEALKSIAKELTNMK
ncbi:PREDICTED: uncharacterized protein LOC106126805 [Papilio xuthus]|uniref:Regulatory protein zeste n=1 Tax=Papilio xuthus TaxID=66420 RepID=A0A194Q8R9_PAPXU|nr:PREDICTED: uncharacterized protein LOC106126805 [Papilio xuthus]KPI99810.1 hypothetical protein RR46_04784 [Papilio xuthus]